MRKNKQQKNEAFLIAFGEAIRLRRTELLMTQETLGERARVHRTYITDIESGQRNLSALLMVRIAEALDMPLSELIYEAEIT